MNYFTMTQPTSTSTFAPTEQKFQVTPGHTTDKVAIAAIKSSLTHALPGMFSPARSAGKKGKSKGAKGNKSGEGLYFPRPEVASKLNVPYHIFQSWELSPVVSSTTVPVTGAVNFSFGSLDQVSQLTAVFDQYRIAMLEVTFHPLANISGSAVSPLFFSVVDLDDSTAVSSTALRDYPGCQMTQAYRRHKHTFVPSIAVAAYSGAFTSFANVSAPWLDVASPSIQHYGVKYAFEVGSSVFSYNVLVRAHFMFRNVR